MSEIVAKKRGRPKKIDKILAEQTETKPEPAKSISTLSSRTSSTTEAVKKLKRSPQSVKQVKGNDIAASKRSASNVSTNAKTLKSRSKKDEPKSRLLQEATAFATNSTRLPTSQESDLPVDSKLEPSLDAATTAQARSSTINNSKDQKRETTSTTPGGSPETRAETPGDSAISTTNIVSVEPSRSLFLNSFLSSEEAAPVIPEDAKVSDRAAFNSPKINIDEIVAGAGISNISSFAQQTPSKARFRESAIPITKSKTFKAHTLSEFPFGLQKQTTTRILPRTIDPLSYRANAFSAFRSLRAAEIGKASLPEPASASNALHNTSQSPSIPPQSSVSPLEPGTVNSQQKSSLQTSSAPQPADTTISNVKRPVQTTPPVPSSTTRPPSSVPKNARQHPRAGAPLPAATDTPKRPTEMTPEELRKNADFKQLRRRWTGVIVGIPVLIVTSYILWNRVDEMEKFEALKREKQEALKPERVRGVMPERVLDEEVVTR